MSTQIGDTTARALRTFVQAFIGVIAIQLGTIAFKAQDGTYVPDVEWTKRALYSATFAGVIALVSFIQNALEDATGKALLKPTDRAVGDAILAGQTPALAAPPLQIGGETGIAYAAGHDTGFAAGLAAGRDGRELAQRMSARPREHPAGTIDGGTITG